MDVELVPPTGPPRAWLLGWLIGRSRWNVLEFHDLDRFPKTWRNYITDILAFSWSFDPADYAPTPALAERIRRTPAVQPPFVTIAEVLDDALTRAGQTTVVDLCSGASGPIVKLAGALNARRGVRGQPPVRFVLTDLYPNLPAMERASGQLPGGVISHRREPVDALACKEAGFRTLFGSFHHFSPPLARALLQDAVNRGQGIAVIEMTGRTLGFLLFNLWMSLFFSALGTVFLRPLSLSRLFFAYIVPIMPFFLTVDGLLSCMRTYSVEELQALVQSVKGADTFDWRIETRQVGPLPSVHSTILVGVPRATSSSSGRTRITTAAERD